MCGSALPKGVVHALLVVTQNRQQVTARLRSGRLRGGPEPLADPACVGEQEGSPERARARRAESVRSTPEPEHRGVGLHQQRGDQELDGVEVGGGADQEAEAELVSDGGPAAIGPGHLMDQRGLCVDVRRVQPQPAHLQAGAAAARWP